MIVTGILLLIVAFLLSRLFDSFARREAFFQSSYTWDVFGIFFVNVTGFIGCILMVAGLLGA